VFLRELSKIIESFWHLSTGPFRVHVDCAGSRKEASPIWTQPKVRRFVSSGGRP